jgi:Tfp pilus assembly protein PilF
VAETDLALIRVRKQDLVIAERNVNEAVASARDAGESWTAIASALGMSRQAASERFTKVGA